MYLSILIPNFSLTAALRLRSEALRASAALAGEDGTLVEVNAAARQQHIVPGMALPKALACDGSLQVLHRCAQAEQTAKRLLWNHAWQITPRIELTAPGHATLQLVRPKMNPLRRQTMALLRSLEIAGLPAQVGLAESIDWSELAARSAASGECNSWEDADEAREALAQLPLEAFPGLPERAIAIARGWGLRTLGALADLPRQALGERLGPELLRTWDRLNGRAQRVLHFAELAPDFTERYDLEDPVDSLEPVCFLLRRATEALEGQLGQVCKVARTLYLRLELADAATYEKSFRLPEPTRQARLLERLLRHHLEQVQLAGAVQAVQLAVEPVAPHGRQAGLFERSVRNPWRLAETLDQLSGILGRENFGSPHRADTHQPDRFTLADLPEELPPADEAPPAGPALLGPVLRRYRPAPAATLYGLGSGPRRIEAEGISGQILQWRGPYRLSGNWWDAAAWAVEEWDVAIAGQGLFRLAQENGQWRIAGAYD